MERVLLVPLDLLVLMAKQFLMALVTLLDQLGLTGIFIFKRLIMKSLDLNQVVAGGQERLW